MKSKAIFYHAGCPVCVDAEQGLVQSIDPEKYDLGIVHLGEDKSRISEAEQSGVKSAPAIVLGNNPYLISFSSIIQDLK